MGMMGLEASAVVVEVVMTGEVLMRRRVVVVTVLAEAEGAA